MTVRFFEQPIFRSPRECPRRHWELDFQGQPTGEQVLPADPTSAPARLGRDLPGRTSDLTVSRGRRRLGYRWEQTRNRLGEVDRERSVVEPTRDAADHRIRVGDLDFADRSVGVTPMEAHGRPVVPGRRRLTLEIARVGDHEVGLHGNHSFGDYLGFGAVSRDHPLAVEGNAIVQPAVALAVVDAEGKVVIAAPADMRAHSYAAITDHIDAFDVARAILAVDPRTRVGVARDKTTAPGIWNAEGQGCIEVGVAIPIGPPPITETPCPRLALSQHGRERRG